MNNLPLLEKKSYPHWNVK